MADGHIIKAMEMLARDKPGPGGPDHDQVPGDASLKLKAIPNVSSERLQRRLDHLNYTVSPENIRNFDEPRRTLVHIGMTRKVITHELEMRGHMGQQFR